MNNHMHMAANMAMNMGGPVGAPMPTMNNGAPVPQVSQRPGPGDDNRRQLNTYVYEYLLKSGLTDTARALLNEDSSIQLEKEGRRDDNGNLMRNGLGHDPMDTDMKNGLDSKRTNGLPDPKLYNPTPDSPFLLEWWSLFWDFMLAHQGRNRNPAINQYVQHTQALTRQRQEQQQAMLRNIRPDNMTPQQYQQHMLRMQNGMAMGLKPNLQRTAMANSQNPNMQMLQKAGQMQRDPSDMDGSRVRPASPGGAENAPSPSKRPRLEGGPFNPNQNMMMPNGGRPTQGMPVQQQHHGNHGNQMVNKPMPNASGPQGQGSPMVPQGPPDGQTLGPYYAEMGPGNVRQSGPGAGQAGNNNHALQDYQMQLMLLEQQNKKRLMMARQEHDQTNMPRSDGPGGPLGPNQVMPSNSPPGRNGPSPKPSEQLKRTHQMMNAANMGSPLPDGVQSRNSPGPGAMTYMNANMHPADNANFFKQPGMDMNMAAQMNGGSMRPPSSHPNQPFNGQMTQQQQMIAQRQQAAAANAQGGAIMQWSNGPNGQMTNQGPQGPQVTPQPRSMPPPSVPVANANANSRNATSSPQVTSAVPPTPQQGNKAAPKKKDSKTAKSKVATGKKSNSNLNSGATPVAEPDLPAEAAATPATPMTPGPAGNFKTQNQAPAQVMPTGQLAAQAPPQPPQTQAPVVAQQHPDPGQTANFMEIGMDFGCDFANPLTSNDVLDSFDFDSFLHADTGEDSGSFDFNPAGFMEGGEIGAE